MSHFFGPSYLLFHIYEAVRYVDRIAYEDDMGTRVGKRAETVILLLTGGVPKSQFDPPAIYLDFRNIGFEHSWYKLPWELSSGKDR